MAPLGGSAMPSLESSRRVKYVRIGTTMARVATLAMSVMFWVREVLPERTSSILRNCEPAKTRIATFGSSPRNSAIEYCHQATSTSERTRLSSQIGHGPNRTRVMTRMAFVSTTRSMARAILSASPPQ
eukprot:Amastigsp_a676911_43.p4 type:complete len:128 gc:universal Amastigsp_a676911_43:1047-664(-)